MEVNNNEVKSAPPPINSKPNKARHNFSRRLKKSILLYPIPIALATLCYINSLNGDFVHDDIFAIKNNPDVTGGTPALQVWQNDFWGTKIHLNTSHKSYRPLTTFSFRINYELGGGRSFWFHVVNVILHCITTGLFIHLLHDVFNISKYSTFFASTLFAVHPIHTEAVCGIVGRADVLAAIFVLLAVIFYMRVVDDDDTCDFPATDQPVYLVCSISLAVIAMLCKEHGVMVLVIMAVIDCLIISQRGVNRVLNGEISIGSAGPVISRFTILGASFLILIGLRFLINGGDVPTFMEQDNPASFSSSLLTRFLTYNYLLAFNFWLLLAPITLCYDWQVGSIPLVESVDDIRNMATITFYMFLFLLLWKCYHVFRSQKTYVNAPVIAASFLILSFIPASNVFLRVGFVVAERILYISSLGFCLLVGHGLTSVMSRFPGKKVIFLTSFTLLVAVLSLRTFHRNQVWQSRQSLFWSGIVTMPKNAKIHYNYANYQKDIGETSKAIHHYEEALSLYPQYASVHNNLGTLLSNQSKAEYHFRQALHYNQHHKGALVNLANILHNRKDDEIAEDLLRKALRLDGNYVEGLVSMSKIMMDTKRNTLAKSYIERAIKVDPYSPDVHNYHGVYLHLTGEYEAAVDSFQRAYTLDSQTLTLMRAVSSFQSLGKDVEAENLLVRALAKNSNIDLMDQLGLLYYRTKQVPKSLDIYRDILKQAPNNTEAATHYANILFNLNETEEAKIIGHRVLSQSPNNVACLQLMTAIYTNKKQLTKAIEYGHAALEQVSLAEGTNTMMSSISFRLGDIYREMKDFDNALKYFEKSIHYDPGFGKAYMYAGAIHHLQNNFEEARTQYERALQINPNDTLSKTNLQKLNNREKGQRKSVR